MFVAATRARRVRRRASGNADAVAAFQFLQRLFTIDTNARGKPEPGLARLQASVHLPMVQEPS